MVSEATGFRDSGVTTSSVLSATSGISTLLAISLSGLLSQNNLTLLSLSCLYSLFSPSLE